MKRYLTLLFFLPLLAFGQFEVIQSTHIPVERENGSILQNPWTGGINAAQVSMFDADLDGAQDDIFLFDKGGDRILIFTGSTQGGERVYTHKPLLSNDFPELTNWALLRDFDCDGKKDIFTYSPIGGAIAVYRNTSTLASGISFELETESVLSFYEFNSSEFTTNIYVSSQDIPGIFDFDGDGDLDFFVFGVGGGILELHLNNSVENNGSCGLDDIALRNRCYGRFVEATENNGIIQDPEAVEQACSFNVVNPKSNGDRPGRGGSGGARHIGSTILAFDATQDGLPEIILGDVTYTNLVYLENDDRGDQLDSIRYVSTSFPSDFGAAAVHLDNFPAGFYEDISGDGVNDLIVGVNNPFGSKNTESVWYYENIGENDLPLFNLVQQDFMQDQTIEFGEATAPSFFDYNNDGLLDLVVGARGKFLGAGLYKPTLSLYKNIGSSTQPAFQLVDSDWLEISTLDIGQFPYPTFADMDNDGDIDMMVGENSGEVHYFINTAGSGNDANFTHSGLVISGGENLDVGQNSTPTLFDINSDGLFDLIIGERNGNLNYYENTGTATDYEFTLESELLGGVTGIEQGYFIGNSNANFFYVEGELHLVVGLESGRMQTFNNISGNLTGDFDMVDGNAFGIDAGTRAKPVILDIDNDDKLDIFCGLVGGGINLYSGDLTIGIEEHAFSSEFINVFPNPTQNNLTLTGTLADSFNTYRIFAITGQQVGSGIINQKTIDVSSLPNGMFIIQLENDSQTATGKFIKK